MKPGLPHYHEITRYVRRVVLIRNCAVMISFSSLKFLWDFISPILSDSIKERIKSNVASERARKHSFNLYRVLGDVRRNTEEFIERFQYYVILLELSESINDEEKGLILGELYFERKGLQYVSKELMKSLPELAEALDELNPQLEIHKYDLIQELLSYRRARQQILTQLEVSVDEFSNYRIDKLRELFNQANINYKLMKNSIDEFRNFLADEFPFKESF